MKKIMQCLFYVGTIFYSAISIRDGEPQLAMWLLLVLVLTELDQIHDTIKTNKSKGDAS
jgi:hypothetical protein